MTSTTTKVVNNGTPATTEVTDNGTSATTDAGLLARINPGAS
jgi:hypothetical protein